MLEIIEDFLKRTGIHPDTFGRLVCNNPDLVWQMREDVEFDKEVGDAIMDFIQHYDTLKGY